MTRPGHRAALGLRDGVAPSCLALPQLRHVPWPTVLDLLTERLPRLTRDEWAARLAAGDVVDAHGRPYAADAPCTSGQRIYYWRQLPDEATVPFDATVLFQDAHLVVADKPHFLPVTPGGRYVRETLLVRLRAALDLPELSPLHRIDRETAGLVLFSVRAAERDAYQRLFRERRIHKTYEAIAPAPTAALAWPLTRVSHLREDETAFYRMREAAAHEGHSPNAETRIQLIEQHGALARYRLEPTTGQRHQLRVHMNALGLPIVGDQFYPTVRRGPTEPEDYRAPLMLLAQTIRFTDPLTGQSRHFESAQRLAWPPD